MLTLLGHGVEHPAKGRGRACANGKFSRFISGYCRYFSRFLKIRRLPSGRISTQGKYRLCGFSHKHHCTKSNHIHDSASRAMSSSRRKALLLGLPIVDLGGHWPVIFILIKLKQNPIGRRQRGAKFGVPLCKAVNSVERELILSNRKETPAPKNSWQKLTRIFTKLDQTFSFGNHIVNVHFSTLHSLMEVHCLCFIIALSA